MSRFPQETAISNRKHHWHRFNLDGPKTSRAEHQRFSLPKRETEMKADLQQERQTKVEGEGKENAENSERGSCTHRITEGQCSFEDGGASSERYKEMPLQQAHIANIQKRRR